MPKDEGIGTKVGLMGDKEYRAALSDISRQLRVLNSDMQASQSAFGDQATTMEGMQDKLEKLGAVYEAEKQKVELMRRQLEAAKATYGENSKEAYSLQIALNKATAQMNETGNEISKTEKGLDTLAAAQEAVGDETDASNMTLKEAEAVLKDVGDSGSDAAAGAEDAAGAIADEGRDAADAEGKNSKLKDALSTVGDLAGGALKAGVEAAAAAMAALAAAAVEAMKAAFDASQSAGTYADDLLTLSVQTGVSAEKLQEWAYSSNLIDTSVDTITGSMTKLLKNMDSAAGGSESAQQKFAELGIAYRDANGNLRDSEAVFWDAIDALGNIDNEAERDAAAMELFGKSAKELNPLIQAGSKAWKEMGKEAHAMGTVFSDENLEKMGAFDDSMQKFNATGEALKNSIGLVMIPAFQPLVDAASSSMGRVAQALQDGVDPDVIRYMMIDVTREAWHAMNELIGVVEEALPAVLEAADLLIELIAKRIPHFVEKLLPIAMDLLQSLLDAVTQNIEPLMDVVTSLVLQVAGFLIENLPVLMDAALTLVNSLLDGLIEALPVLIPAGVEMVAQLAVGLVQAIPDLVAKLPEIVTAVWDGLKAVDWPGLGTEILTAITDGIGKIGESIMGMLGVPDDLKEGVKQGWEAFAGFVSDGISSVFGGVTSFLGGLFDPPGEGEQAGVSALWDSFAGLVSDGIMGVLGGVVTFFKTLFDPPEDSEQQETEREWGTFGENLSDALGTALQGASAAISGIFSAGTAAIQAFPWEDTGEKLGVLAGKLTGFAADSLSGVFTAADEAVKKIDWSGLGESVGELINGVTGIEKDALAGIFTATQEAIQSIDWSALGNDVADGLSRAWGILAGVGDVALGIGESVVGAGKQGVGALKDWIASWRSDEGVESEAVGVGAQVISDVGAGVEREVPALEITAQEAADALLEAIKGEILIGQDGVNTAAADVVADAFSEMKDAVEAAGFDSIGMWMDEGVARGIRNYSGSIMTAAWNAAMDAYDAACRALDVNSPSRKGEFIGEMFDMGVAGGISDNSRAVMDAAAELGELAMGETMGAFGGMPSVSNVLNVDYGAMRDAMAEAIVETGAGQSVIAMDGRAVGQTVEPYTSRASWLRQQRSVSGRASRMVMG